MLVKVKRTELSTPRSDIKWRLCIYTNTFRNIPFIHHHVAMRYAIFTFLLNRPRCSEQLDSFTLRMFHWTARLTITSKYTPNLPLSFTFEILITFLCPQTPKAPSERSLKPYEALYSSQNSAVHIIPHIFWCPLWKKGGKDAPGLFVGFRWVLGSVWIVHWL